MNEHTTTHGHATQGNWPSTTNDTLEEIARRLVAIHYPLAEHLDGDPELQRQTRKRIEELMAYVDAAIDAAG